MTDLPPGMFERPAIYELDVALRGLDWDRDERVDMLMSGFGGEREGSGSDGRTRDLIYSFSTMRDALRARRALLLDQLSVEVVELGAIRTIGPPE